MALTPLYNVFGSAYFIWDVYPDRVVQYGQYLYYPYGKDPERTYGEIRRTAK